MMDSGHAYRDQELLQQFASGSEAAVRQLYDRYYKPLCWFAEQLVKQSQDAEDIALESFVKLLHKRRDFDSLGQLQSFLYTATRNACYNFLRDERRHLHSHEELGYLSQHSDTAAINEELTARVLTLIYSEMEQLAPQCRSVFKGIFLEGKTTAQLAGELGISTQTVLNQKTRALQQLRLMLYKEGLYSTALFLHCLALLAISGRG